ncbi:MAG TPA: hypothetical protein VFZ89_16870 [Solirubrobacteraceae bacterium]
MATRPSHIYASTLSRRERAWGRHRRRRSARATTLAMLLSAALGVVIQHVA